MGLPEGPIVKVLAGVIVGWKGGQATDLIVSFVA